MKTDDLENFFSTQANILPSHGFVGRVMESVRSEGTASKPIPFPWKVAVPGFLSLGGLLVLAVISLMQSFSSLREHALPATLRFLIDGARNLGAPWITLALLLTVFSVTFSACVWPSRWSR